MKIKSTDNKLNSNGMGILFLMFSAILLFLLAFMYSKALLNDVQLYVMLFLTMVVALFGVYFIARKWKVNRVHDKELKGRIKDIILSKFLIFLIAIIIILSYSFAKEFGVVVYLIGVLLIGISFVFYSMYRKSYKDGFNKDK